ncbi:IS110 family transposase [Streptomyces mirabilis]|uniref:IS110 family transposase n=1 Tax=Streptomyces mirabilis TaxID=68239 RepID=UPI00367CBD97
MSRIWAGIDAGKGPHHCVVVNGEGDKLLSRRVMNDGSELLNLLADVLELGDEVAWAIDLPDGCVGLVIMLLSDMGSALSDAASNPPNPPQAHLDKPIGKSVFMSE